ncbi:unnamed protein product [Lampetra fluviatilis]
MDSVVLLRLIILVIPLFQASLGNATKDRTHGKTKHGLDAPRGLRPRSPEFRVGLIEEPKEAGEIVGTELSSGEGSEKFKHDAPRLTQAQVMASDVGDGKGRAEEHHALVNRLFDNILQYAIRSTSGRSNDTKIHSRTEPDQKLPVEDVDSGKTLQHSKPSQRYHDHHCHSCTPGDGDGVIEHEKHDTSRTEGTHPEDHPARKTKQDQRSSIMKYSHRKVNNTASIKTLKVWVHEIANALEQMTDLHDRAASTLALLGQRMAEVEARLSARIDALERKCEAYGDTLQRKGGLLELMETIVGQLHVLHREASSALIGVRVTPIP